MMPDISAFASLEPAVEGAVDTLGGIPLSAQGYVLAGLAEKDRPIIHICPSDRDMETTAAVCRFFAPQRPVLTFPAWDCLPYDRVSPSHAIVAQRINTLTQLAAAHTHAPRTSSLANEGGVPQPPPILITTIGAAIQKLPPREWLSEVSLVIRTGETLDRDLLVMFLTGNGYTRVSKVMEPGEFALRGGIIDLFPPGHEYAVRIDYFGDEIESLKTFDPLSQISSGTRDELTLQPVGEVMLRQEHIERFRSGYRGRFGAVTQEDPLYESISAGRRFAGMEHWLPLFYERLETLFDYLPEALITMDERARSTRYDRLELLQDYYQARGAARRKNEPAYHPLPPEELYLLEDAWQQRLASHCVLTFSAFHQQTTVHGNGEIGIKPAPDFSAIRKQPDGDIFAAVHSAIAARDKQIMIACTSQGSLERIKNILKDHHIHEDAGADLPPPAEHNRERVSFIILPIESGFETDHLFLLTEQDIFGERIIRTQKRKKPSEAFLAEAAAFSEGELVVHKEHGIGRFDGLITVDVHGARHDCLKLVYAGEDKLFLPVENMDVISRFGSESEGVPLDKLGGVAWQKRKAAMKKRLKLAAEQLLKIAAKRAEREAPILAPNPGAYSEFCARFPYVETDDQQSAIDDVLADLAQPKPMDRLICGDVGFGKTEVALRAAFAAVSAEQPVQVVVVAPTTLLARQHAENFRARFEGLPYTIRTLSRLVSTKQANDTRRELAEGGVDIVVGTHALLSRKIEFHNLGLVIVDEEQHFGVAQKERLKQLRANVHVLTLSATPIPRTLQLALSGVRELSLITTPPVDRLATRSFVMPFDGMVIREAILREMHRGGKSFYVTPRIKHISELRRSLQELVPEVKIAVAHGQMAAKELDDIMNAFYDGQYDVLLSTAIIESGLDVPTANTIIVNHAEMFGLAQLYQLRGRVGRGKIRAYAYFTLPHRKTFTAQAYKRLEVMQTLDTLGAGFTLASHDMDIRGFGNLLGEEQSGHVREVGVELYQSMLEEAITTLRRGKSQDEAAESVHDWSPQINLGRSVLIPESYIEDLDLRLSLYRRLAALETQEEIESFAAELIDRFGPLPAEVRQLLDVLHIKQLCKQAGVERIDTGPKGAVFTFRENRFARPEALLQYIASHPRHFKLRTDHKLVYMDRWQSEQERFDKINRSVEAIARLAA